MKFRLNFPAYRTQQGAMVAQTVVREYDSFAELQSLIQAKTLIEFDPEHQIYLNLGTVVSVRQVPET